MKIATKFIGSSALLALWVAIFSGSSYWLNHKAADALEASYRQSQRAATAAGQLASALQDELASVSRLAVLSDKRSETAYYRKRYEAFSKTLEDFALTVAEEDLILQAQVDTIRTQHAYIEELANRALAEDLSAQQLEGLSRSLKVFEDSINIYIQALLQESEEQAEAYRMQSKTFYAQVAWLEAIGFVTLLLLLAIQFQYCLRPVTLSLKRLQSGVDRLGRHSMNGSLGKHPLADATADESLAEIQLSTGDELQRLAEAFSQMSNRLAESYRELEHRVAERTDSLHQANQTLQVEVRDRTEAEARLKRTLEQLQQAQLQLLQAEKMSSLSQLVAGVAHEINNPASFIQGNLEPAQEYVDSLLTLLRGYQAECPEASEELLQAVEQADVDFIQSDFPRLLSSMRTGVDRITTIVRSLRTFSHLDESETKVVDIHQGLESVLLLLVSQLGATPHRLEISIVRDYGKLPEIYCYPSQLNQVFMGLLTNAIDALTPAVFKGPESATSPVTDSVAKTLAEVADDVPTIVVKTKVVAGYVRISIQDNGPGMSEQVRSQIFNPFFTTKQVGSGVGLGLATIYQIVVANHQGMIRCQSSPGEGACFVVDIPLTLKLHSKPAAELVA